MTMRCANALEVALHCAGYFYTSFRFVGACDASFHFSGAGYGQTLLRVLLR